MSNGMRGRALTWRVAHPGSFVIMESGRGDRNDRCHVHALFEGGTVSDSDGAKGTGGGTSAAVKETAHEAAGEGAGLVGEKAADVAGTAQERAGDVAAEATSQVQDVAGELRDRLQSQAESQTRRLAQGVRALADELGAMGKSGAPDSPATRAVRQVSNRGHGVATRLEAGGPQGVLSDLQDFARRRPGVFLAGAALAGFATARLAKGAKSAGSGANGSQGDRSLEAADEDGLPTAQQPTDSYEQVRPTPSYGGPVSPAPSGPLPVRDPYPNPDPRQP
ncbi:hypothetical protein ACH4LT_16935 [Streptomyces clavifer]|uniref:hypothetical protein n=1 Tax=Streptomyces clavifer TaxID=68188 RepID=UPI0037B39782